MLFYQRLQESGGSVVQFLVLPRRFGSISITDAKYLSGFLLVKEQLKKPIGILVFFLSAA